MTDASRSGLRWAELITTMGVLVSLVFVGWEIRQNTAVARSQARTDMARMDQEWLLTLAQDSALAILLQQRWAPSDSAEAQVARVRAETMLTAQLRTLENAYLLREEGLLPESALEAYGAAVQFPTLAGFTEDFWPRTRATFDPSFVRYFETRWGLSAGR